MNSIRQAVIFCGGLGTRLGKITKNLQNQWSKLPENLF